MSKLNRLNKSLKKRTSKRDVALKGRNKQLTLYEKTKKEGHRNRAKELTEEVQSHEKAIKKLEKLVSKEKAKQKKKLDRAWGGTKKIIVKEVRPVAKKHNVKRTSSKRGAKHYLTILNPLSDHSVLNKKSFADDYGTYNGKRLAEDIAKSLGISNYSTGNFKNYYIKRGGKTFRIQILWAVKGHYNHVHVGIRRS
jgi:truncated hemoglobin YjbI